MSARPLPGINPLFAYAATVTATAAASLAPLVVPAFHDRGGLAGVGAALVELKGRLFPFGDRGLVHSYWAPNAWALYAFLDRVAMKASGREGGGATRGVVETQIEYLPAPGPLPVSYTHLTLPTKA